MLAAGWGAQEPDWAKYGVTRISYKKLFIEDGAAGPLGGVTIKLGVNDKNNKYGRFKWVQTVRTNAPKDGKKSPYNDSRPENAPFYPSDDDYDDFESVMSDNPSRYLSKNSYWIGELSLVSQNDDGTYSAIFTIQYGFINAAGGTSILPIQEIAPSKAHLNSFTGKKFK